MHLSGDPEPGDVCGLFFFFFSVAPNSVGSEGLRCYGFSVASESASCLHKNPGPLSPAMNTVPLEADAVLYMLVFGIFCRVLSSLEIRIYKRPCGCFSFREIQKHKT